MIGFLQLFQKLRILRRIRRLLQISDDAQLILDALRRVVAVRRNQRRRTQKCQRDRDREDREEREQLVERDLAQAVTQGVFSFCQEHLTNTPHSYCLSQCVHLPASPRGADACRPTAHRVSPS